MYMTEIQHYTFYGFGALMDDEPELWKIAKEEFAKEFSEWMEEHEVDEDPDKAWLDFFEDHVMEDVLDAIGSVLVKSVLGGTYDYWYDDSDFYELVVKLVVRQPCQVSRENIEDLIRIYQKENGLPELPEIIMSKILPKEVT